MHDCRDETHGYRYQRAAILSFAANAILGTTSNLIVLPKCDTGSLESVQYVTELLERSVSEAMRESKSRANAVQGMSGKVSYDRPLVGPSRWWSSQKGTWQPRLE